MCQRFNALPEAGGVLDQDSVTMKEMQVLGNVYSATERMFNAGQEVNKKLTVNDRHLLKWLDDLGLLGGIGG